MRKDDVTMELPGVAKRPGRPKTGTAKTAAERKRAQRAKLADAGLETIAVVVPNEVADALRGYCARKTADAEPLSMGQAVERILRDRLLRKR